MVTESCCKLLLLASDSDRYCRYPLMETSIYIIKALLHQLRWAEYHCYEQNTFFSTVR